MATLAELVIKLSADSASLRQDFEKVRGYADNLASGISKAFSAIGSALPAISVVGIGKELFDLADAAAKAGTEIYKAQQISDLGAEQLSALRVVAKETKKDFSGLSTTLARFGKNVEAAFIDPQGGTGKLLGALFTKTEVESLKLAPVGQRLQEVTKRIFDLGDAAEKNFAAAAFFGRGWMQNTETLQKLAREGFEPLIAQAGILGQLLGQDDVEAAHRFSVAFADVELSFSGIKRLIGQELVDVAVDAGGALTDLADTLDKLKANRGVQLKDVIGGEGITKFTPEDIPEEFRGLKVDKTHGSLAELMAKPEKADPEVAKRQKEISNWLTELHEKLTKLNDGETRAALEKMARIGASPSQLASGQALLDQIDTIHRQELAGKEWTKGYEDYTRLLDELRPAVTGTDAALREYYQTMLKISRLAAIGIDTADVDLLNRMTLEENAAKGLVEEINALQGEIVKQGIPKELPFTWGDKALGGTDILDKHKADLDILTAQAGKLGTEMSSAFTQMIIYGRGFQDTLKGLIQIFAEFILKTYVFNSIAGALGKSGIAGVFGSFFGHLAGGLAEGGPAYAGESYLVGERGPEIFSPGVSGSIIPHGGGGAGINIENLDARGADAAVEYRVMRALKVIYTKASLNGFLLNQEMAKRS